MSERELTEAQERYNVAKYELFQLGAYGHCTYTSGELLSKEGQRRQQDYNDRLHAAAEELEAALLSLVAERATSFQGDWSMVAAWLQSLANLEEIAELATPEEEPVVVAYTDPGLPGVLLCVTDVKRADPTGGHMTPLTTEDLPSGGICTHCGVDVLIPQVPGVPLDLAPTAGLEKAAGIAEDVSEELRGRQEFERSNGALDVMTELRRRAAAMEGKWPPKLV